MQCEHNFSKIPLLNFEPFNGLIRSAEKVFYDISVQHQALEYETQGGYKNYFHNH